MVGISGCGSENTFWLSQTFSIWPAALSLSRPPLPASATLLSQNIKGSSPTCWPLWSMFCVFVFACQCVCVANTCWYVYTCLYVSFCVFVCCQAWVQMNICIYIKKKINPGYTVYACTVSDDVHACDDMSGGLGLPWCDQAGARRVSGSHGPMGS